MSTIKYQGKSFDIPWVREAEKLVAKSEPAPQKNVLHPDSQRIADSLEAWHKCFWKELLKKVATK